MANLIHDFDCISSTELSFLLSRPKTSDCTFLWKFCALLEVCLAFYSFVFRSWTHRINRDLQCVRRSIQWKKNVRKSTWIWWDTIGNIKVVRDFGRVLYFISKDPPYSRGNIINRHGHVAHTAWTRSMMSDSLSYRNDSHAWSCKVHYHIFWEHAEWSKEKDFHRKISDLRN